MMGQNRMSPLTALFIGIFGAGAVGIVSGSAIVLYGMRIVDTKASTILGLAQNTVEGLPELIQSLPPAIGDLLNDRRAPEYAAEIDLEANFVPDEQSGGVLPALKITNRGSEVVSMLAIRVAALSTNNMPLREWTEVVATPIAIEDDWRGPLFPGNSRHVRLSPGWRRFAPEDDGALTAAVEISEIRIWQPTNRF